MLTMQAGTSGAVAVVDVTGVIGWDDAQCLEFADKLKAAANQGAFQHHLARELARRGRFFRVEHV